MENELHLIALSLIPKVGPITARRLLSHFGDPESIFRAKPRELLRLPGIGPETVAAIRDPALLDSAARQLEWAETLGVVRTTCLDDDYPQRLRPFDDAPFILYRLGEVALDHPRVVSIVGTRTPTERGRAFVQRLVEDLSPYQVLIVSGMALGIDIAAHRASHERGIPTLGVMAHGLHTVFPPGHLAFAETLCTSGGGGLLSEFPLGTLPRKEFFPLRNRIVAALADAVVVVESNVRGGSMITAQLANDYQKDVFAVPGRPEDAKSAGCNLLVKTHRAALLESAADLVECLRWSLPGQSPRPTRVQPQLFPELPSAASELLDQLRERGPLSLDELLRRGDHSASALSALLLELEFKGLVKALPGKMFALV
jgi:DNA processing protein